MDATDMEIQQIHDFRKSAETPRFKTSVLYVSSELQLRMRSESDFTDCSIRIVGKRTQVNLET